VNRLALAWLDAALVLEAENRALRELVLDLALALAFEREHFGFARDEIESRFEEAA
jgi:hypothetical protein